MPELRIPCVGAILTDGGRILLIRRGHEPEKGRWSLPGGRIEPGETDQQALVREVREETGLEVIPGPLAGGVDPPGPRGRGLVIRVSPPPVARCRRRPGRRPGRGGGVGRRPRAAVGRPDQCLTQRGRRLQADAGVSFRLTRSGCYADRLFTRGPSSVRIPFNRLAAGPAIVRVRDRNRMGGFAWLG